MKCTRGGLCRTWNLVLVLVVLTPSQGWHHPRTPVPHCPRGRTIPALAAALKVSGVPGQQMGTIYEEFHKHQGLCLETALLRPSAQCLTITIVYISDDFCCILSYSFFSAIAAPQPLPGAALTSLTFPGTGRGRPGWHPVLLGGEGSTGMSGSSHLSGFFLTASSP